MVTLKRRVQSAVRLAQRIAARGAPATHAARARAALSQGRVPWEGPAAFNFTIDFELCWGNARQDGADIPLAQRAAWARRVRENFWPFLELSDRYQVPVTWAVVTRMLRPTARPAHAFSPAWARRDWYAHQEELALDQDLWDGEPYLRALRDRAALHEVISHGFGHIDYADRATDPAVAEEDLRLSHQLLEQAGFQAGAFVFPCNHVAHAELLPAQGYAVARGTDARWHMGTSGAALTPVGFWISPGMMGPGEALAVLKEGIASRAFVHPWMHLHEPDPRQRDLLEFMHPLFEEVANARAAGRIETLSFRQVGSKLAAAG